MAFFHSDESRQRARHIEKAIAITTDVLQTNTDARRVLTPELAASHIATLGRMFIPNVRHGRLDMPKNQVDTDNIPVVALTVGETLIAGRGLAMTPSQQRFFQQQAQDWYPIDQSGIVLNNTTVAINRLISDRVTEPLYSPTEKTYGFVTSSTITYDFGDGAFSNLGDSTIRSINGQPVVGLVMHPEDPFEMFRSPSVLVHDLQHYFQYTAQPICPSTNTPEYTDLVVRRELEAYHVGGNLEIALYHSDDRRYAGNNNLLSNWDVEAIRHAHADPNDPFAPLGIIRRLVLEEVGLDLGPAPTG